MKSVGSPPDTNTGAKGVAAFAIPRAMAASFCVVGLPRGILSGWTSGVIQCAKYTRRSVARVSRSARIISQYEKGLVLRLGKYRATASSGLTFLVPVIEDLIKVIEAKILPDLKRGRHPDRKTAHQIGEALHVVARELEV